MAPSVADNLARKATATNRNNRPVRLNFVFISIRSATKFGFLTGVTVAVLSILATMILWLLLVQSGFLDQTVGVFLSGLSPSPSTSSPISVASILGFGPVLGFAIIIGILDILSLTLLGTISALLYNRIVLLTGGIRVGFETQ